MKPASKLSKLRVVWGTLWTCSWCQKWGRHLGMFSSLTVQLSNPCNHMPAPCHHVKRKIPHMLAAHSLCSECLPLVASLHRYQLCVAFLLPASVCSPLSFFWRGDVAGGPRTILPPILWISFKLGFFVLATKPSINSVSRTSNCHPLYLRQPPNMNLRIQVIYLSNKKKME